LLAFSRQQVIHPSVFDVNAVVNSMDQMLRRVISEQVQLQCRLSPDPVWVRADSSQLEQVLLNLVVNARDALQSGGGDISVETAAVELDDDGARRLATEAEPGSYVRLRVADNGVGMDEPVRSRVLEPFFTTKSDGTGLGLSMVYGIVRQSGGHVDIVSTRNVGTSVDVYLPLVVPEVANLGGPETHAANVENSTPATLLFVEDEDGVRKVVEQMLSRSGYRVITARNGREALEIARPQLDRIDLLLTDVVMPEMGGPELAEALLALKPDLGVLFVSGYAAGGPGTSTLPKDAEILLKPFDTAVLVSTVDELLNQR
jgi:CheY-like chemotaxis protein